MATTIMIHVSFFMLHAPQEPTTMFHVYMFYTADSRGVWGRLPRYKQLFMLFTFYTAIKYEDYYHYRLL